MARQSGWRLSSALCAGILICALTACGDSNLTEPSPAPDMVAQTERAYSTRAFTQARALLEDLQARFEADHQRIRINNYQVPAGTPDRKIADAYSETLGQDWTPYTPDLPRGYEGAWAHAWRRTDGAAFMVTGMRALEGETHAPVFTLTGE